MRILFVVMGIGLGHATRCYAIMKKLKAEIIVGSYLNGYEFFKDKYETFKVPYITLPSKFSVSFFDILFNNIFTPLHLLREHLKLKRKIKKFKPDVIVTDSEIVAVYTAKKMKKRVIGLHNHDLRDIKDIIDNPPNKNLEMQAKAMNKFVGWGNKNCDRVIVPELLGKRKDGKVSYIDPIVDVSEKIKKNNSILIMLGGSDFPHSFMEKLLPFLKKINEKFIIFGYKDFEDGNITSYRFNPDFVSYLRGCKGLITMAGYSSLSEALYYKVPSLVFSIPNHMEQYINANKVSKIFMVDLNSENPEKSITNFLKSIPEQKKKLKKLKIKNGLDEAVRIIKNET